MARDIGQVVDFVSTKHYEAPLIDNFQTDISLGGSTTFGLFDVDDELGEEEACIT